jgi:nifR3 family TIM-barrel protein
MENQEKSPSFFIGKVPIFGRVMLAPMDGYTDLPFRLICRQQGSSISYSEFINGIDIKNGHPHLKTKLEYSQEERPFAFQVFDDDPGRLLFAALELRKLNPDFIDVNMGCSARNVSNRGAGSGLLKEPQKIGRIIKDLVANLDIPVTAKIRLGWDDSSRNYLEVAKIIEQNGASAIAVHARTRKQEYSGAADWSAIREIKESLTIPVIGNGDVNSQDDVQRMITMTGCDAVMIGRAAIGNPWIFRPESYFPDINARYQMIEHHLELTIIHFGQKIGMLVFRKHLSRYLAGYLTTLEIRKMIFNFVEPIQLMDYIKYLLGLETSENERLGK